MASSCSIEVRAREKTPQHSSWWLSVQSNSSACTPLRRSPPRRWKRIALRVILTTRVRHRLPLPTPWYPSASPAQDSYAKTWSAPTGFPWSRLWWSTCAAPRHRWGLWPSCLKQLHLYWWARHDRMDRRKSFYKKRKIRILILPFLILHHASWIMHYELCIMNWINVTCNIVICNILILQQLCIMNYALWIE